VDGIFDSSVMASAPDEQVISAVLAGKKELFEIIVRRYSRRLFRVATSVLRNDAEAEDTVQDAFISAYQHLDQYAGRARFATWLTRIAVHSALGKLAARPKDCVLRNEEGEDYAWIPCPQRNPEQALCRQESLATLEAAIKSLPSGYRQVVMLRDLHEFDTASAARQLSVSEANVKVRLHRAHAMLKRKLSRSSGSSNAGCAAAI
jgi:RNA polymerase sigma-70 factor (ECF subfamily)